MLCESLVQKRVVRREQFQNGAILTKNAVYEKLCLTPEGFAQGFIPIGKQEFVRLFGFDIAQIQPLSGKVRDHRFRTWISEHTADLLLEGCWGLQFSGDGRVEQLIVGN